MGIETLLALALQAGSAVGTGVSAVGSALGVGGAGAGAAGTATTAAGTGAAAAGTAATSTGILGTGVTVGEAATGLATATGVASSVGAFDPKEKSKSDGRKVIETDVGANVKKKKGKRSVTSTVQGGGLKRNTLG